MPKDWRLVAFLDRLIDEVGEAETHELTRIPHQPQSAGGAKDSGPGRKPGERRASSHQPRQGRKKTTDSLDRPRALGSEMSEMSVLRYLLALDCVETHFVSAGVFVAGPSPTISSTVSLSLAPS